MAQSSRTKEVAKLEQEIARLSRENEELARRASRERTPAEKSAHRRWVLSIICVVVASVMSLLAVASVWLDRQVMDTDTYVKTVSPLSRNPAIQIAIADKATDALFKHFNVEARAREALPEGAAFLAAPLAGGLKDFTRQEAQNILASEQFGRIWEGANRRAHGALVTALTGEGKGAISITSTGAVNIDLGKVISKIRSALNKRGITVLNNVSLSASDKQFTIFHSAALARIRRGVLLLNKLAFWLPLLAIALFAAAIGISPTRRKTVLLSGLGLIAGMVVLYVVMAIGRSYYLGAVTEALVPEDAAAAFFDIVTRNLLTATKAGIALGAAVALGAILFEPVTTMIRNRKAAQKGAPLIITSWDFGVFGAWVKEYKTILQVLGIVIGLIVLISWSNPGPLVVLGITMVVLFYEGLAELFSKGPTGHQMSR